MDLRHGLAAGLGCDHEPGIRSAGVDGPGLLPSGPVAGAADGYIDYLDRDGAWIGTGPDPPAGTAFVRRWSVSPVPAAGPDALLLQVAVVAASVRGGAGATTVRPGDPGVTWLATVRVRQ